MTAKGGFIPATRRADVLGVHSLHHFHFHVPDLARAQNFYGEFGLDARDEGGSLALRTFGTDHVWGSLSEGPRKKLSHLSFGAFEDDLPRFRVRLQELGVAQLDPPAPLASNGLWFRDPEGTLIEIGVAEKSSPNAKSIVDNASTPANVRAMPDRSRLPLVRPRRLAHVLVFVTDVPRAMRFYSAVLGLRLSDKSGDAIAFMHGVHGSDHHLVAFAKSNAPGLHHLSWDVASTHEVGLGAMQMADKGHTAGWGLGRHVLGSNFFHYVRDPWGAYSEYSSDIDYIPADQDWDGGDHPLHDGFYAWGPNPPEDFIHNYEGDG